MRWSVGLKEESSSQPSPGLVLLASICPSIHSSKLTNCMLVTVLLVGPLLASHMLNNAFALARTRKEITMAVTKQDYSCDNKRSLLKFTILPPDTLLWTLESSRDDHVLVGPLRFLDLVLCTRMYTTLCLASRLSSQDLLEARD